MTNATEPNFDIRYDGWAPCAHAPHEQVAFAEWLRGTMEMAESPDDGDKLETLLWRLCDLNATPSLGCDQWVCVVSKGTIAGRSVHTRIQGDTFLAAVAESFRWWHEKTKELSGE